MTTPSLDIQPRLDLVVATAAVDAASVFGPGETADALCLLDTYPFTGAELVAELYGYDPAVTVSRLVGLTYELEVSYATVRTRGMLLLNGTGRMGIAVGRGYVVEPAGRAYMLTDPDINRWRTAYQPHLLTPTLLQRAS